METLARLQARSHLSHLCGRYLSSRARSSRRAGAHDQGRAQERSAWTWGGHGQALGSWAETPTPPGASTAGGLGPWAARGTAMGLGEPHRRVSAPSRSLSKIGDTLVLCCITA